MQPLISVIVPVYNGEPYLKNCIETIEAQTYRPLEVIIVNDGSTDKTAEVCAGLAKEYPNLRYITTDDLGVSVSRNNGIAQAKGEYLTFVDADDRIHPQLLEHLYDAIVQTDSDIAGCGFGIWRNDQEWEILSKSVAATPEAGKRYHTAADYIAGELLQGNSRCWSKLYRRKTLDAMKQHTGTWFTEGLTIGEDMLFLMHLLQETARVVELDFKGYGYYQNPQGAMNRSFRPEYMDQLQCWELAREQVRTLSPESEHKINSILLISILLTAGKLAALPGAERRQYEGYVKECHQKLLCEKKDRDAVRLLTKGYRFKVCFFAAAPKLYLWCYHLCRKCR